MPEPASVPISPASVPTAARPSPTLVGIVAAAVVAVAVSGYLWKGSPDYARQASAVAGREAAKPTGTPTELEQIAAMVDQLAARMKERPGDAEGWTMLARSYTVLGRFAEAAPAYAKAIALQPSSPGLLADYADVLIAANDGRESAASNELIAHALALDAHHPKALALAGTAAYDRGDYAGAAAQWQRLAAALPPGSEVVQQVEASVAEARQKAGLAPAAPGPAPAAQAGATAVPPAGPSIGAGKSVSGTVSLAPGLAAQTAPGDTVFVFARAPGSRMPLAVRRATVAELPLSFTLDDSMAMSPAARLSGAAEVVVGARVSKSGNAIPQPGDLAGEAAPVAPGASGIAVQIGTVVGSR